MGTTTKTTEPAVGKIWKHVSPRLIGADGRKLMQDSTSAGLKSLYHHMEWRYAQLALQNGHLRLSAVSGWSDPYEKAWAKILFDRPGSALKGAVAYGICFTTSTYDEPAWRMHGFSRPPPMVRLRLRKDSILDAVRASLAVHAGSWFLGSVRYRPTADLNSLARIVVGQQQKDVSRMAAAMLLHKRNAFEFEKEVRLLLILPPGTPAGDAFFLPIPTSVVTQVMSSPHTTDVECHRVESELSVLGKKLTRSGVLRGPNWTLLP
jgi:hypothetical protein